MLRGAGLGGTGGGPASSGAPAAGEGRRSWVDPRVGLMPDPDCEGWLSCGVVGDAS